MFRLIVLLLTITVLSLGLAWIADEPGRVAIDWGDYHIESSLLVLLAVVALGAMACMMVYYVLFAILRSPRTWLRSRLAKRQMLGLEALTAAFAAIATQDIRAARRQIKRAQQYLPHQPLTLMLASQVARLEGNESQSRLYLEQMLKTESTEFMAMRGLVENARRNHDDDMALVHAEKALTLKPNDPWLTTTLVGLYTRKARAQEALRLLDLAARKRTITRRQQRSLTAFVLYEHAKPLVAQQRWDEAQPALHDALKCEPGFVPASALLAEAYSRQGKTTHALKVISRAWKAAPHPLLTHALLECLAPEETRKKVLRTAEKLARQQPDHRESHFLNAALALKGNKADTARGEIQHLLDARETARACAVMAEVEHAAGNGDASAHWLKRSHSALPDPGYACDTCHRPSPAWELTCPQCGSVGSMVWK
jgi:HemY protein